MRFSELKWKIVKNSNFLIIRIFARKFNGKSPGCDLTTISNISKIPNFYSENPDFWHENSKFWWLKLSKSLSFFLLGGHISFLAIFFVFYTLSRHGVRKGITLTLGKKKIHILSKSSNLQVLIFDKIPHFKNLIFHMIHITKNLTLDKIQPYYSRNSHFSRIRFWDFETKNAHFCGIWKIEILKFRIWDFGKMWGFETKNKWGF